MPDWKQEISKQLAGLNLPPSREQEIIEELSVHLEDLSVANYQNQAAIGVWYKPRQCFCH